MDTKVIRDLIKEGKLPDAVTEVVTLAENLPSPIRNSAYELSGKYKECIRNSRRGIDVGAEISLITRSVLCLLEEIDTVVKGKITDPCKETKEWLEELKYLNNYVLDQWRNESNLTKNSYYQGILTEIDNQIFSIEKAGNYTYSKTQAYLLDRIKIYESLASGMKKVPSIDFQNTTFIKLKKRLLEGKEVFEKPTSINVRGTIFPSALLSTGWWERLDNREKEFHKWKDDLQNWLFQGFDLWGPSWDFSWHALDDDCSFSIAQLGDGEEANTIPVILPNNIAVQLKSDIENSNNPWGGKEVQVSGVIGHKRHFLKKISKLDIVGGLMDYCIFLDRNNSKHKIAILKPNTEIYSGYLWKCVVPKDWIKNINNINLDDVYFIWEHTDFTKADAVKYNLDSLYRKEKYIEKLNGSLVLLQKSSNHVPGNALWDSRLFYDFLSKSALEIQ